MADPLNPRETFTTEEGVLANMWALVELLERKGLYETGSARFNY